LDMQPIHTYWTCSEA